MMIMNDDSNVINDDHGDHNDHDDHDRRMVTVVNQ